MPSAPGGSNGSVVESAEGSMKRANSETNMAVSALFQMMAGAEERGPSESSLGSLEGGVAANPETKRSVEQGPWVVRYSPQERKLRVERYREKKRMRTFNKTIRYDVRKRLADTRPRVRGRFSKPIPPTESRLTPNDENSETLENSIEPNNKEVEQTS